MRRKDRHYKIKNVEQTDNIKGTQKAIETIKPNTI